MLPVRTILHPTDFSKHSECAFRLACSLARDYNKARLVILHVAQPFVFYGEGIPLQPPAETYSEDYQEKLWEALRRLQESDARIRELRIETRFEEGDPATEILRLAKESGCDLIVMGTHGRTGLSRLLMGSVAEQVVRRASCPVLTVKTPFPRAQKADEFTPEPAEKPLEVLEGSRR